MLNQVVNNSYWYMVLSPPIILFNELSELSGVSGVSDMNRRLFHCTVKSFTPPSEIIYECRRGDILLSFRHDMGKTFTTVWYEYQNAPIIQQLSSWTNIFDSFLKISQLCNDEFISANKYKGECWFLCVRPTTLEERTEDTIRLISVDDIEQVMYFEGVIPQTTNIDTLNQDSDMVQVSVTFVFDGFPQRKVHSWILDSVVKEMNNNYISSRCIKDDKS